MFNSATLTTASAFSINIWSDLQNMWQYGFVRNAFAAGTIVAIVAGVVGYFVVLRRLSFAAHALSHAGFAGAAGAVLIGLNPLTGLLAFTVGGGMAMGALGKRAVNRDVQIGTVLAFMLGLGVLFISLYKGYATEAYSLLFGEILGISSVDVIVTLVAGAVVLLALALLYRPLLFTSLDEDVAEAKGVPVLAVGLLFMAILAVTTAIAVQVVGVLLIFALLVTPAAIAQRFASKPLEGMLISVLVSLLATWLGLFVSYYLPYPVSFFIISLVFVLYIMTRFVRRAGYAVKQEA
jgi:zinc/manganese transport system permease protein